MWPKHVGVVPHASLTFQQPSRKWSARTAGEPSRLQKRIAAGRFSARIANVLWAVSKRMKASECEEKDGTIRVEGGRLGRPSVRRHGPSPIQRTRRAYGPLFKALKSLPSAVTRRVNKESAKAR